MTRPVISWRVWEEKSEIIFYPNYILSIPTATIGFFTVVLAVVAILQWETLEKTDKTLKAQQRPWVSVKPVIAGPLTFTDEEARVEIAFLLERKTYGHSCREYVKSTAEIGPYFYFNDGAPIDAMKKICARAKAAPDENPVLGHAIFPKDKFTYSINLGKRKLEIERLRQIGHKKKRKWFGPVIVGCVRVIGFRMRRGRHVTGVCGRS